ncbi:MAG TPA: cytochrome oxidase assembly protein [Blastocatellia bacterium]|nr:cytochrome oxidase assembly protein [Blastocatellia bacterium]
MVPEKKLSKFAKYSIFTLAYNLVVIIWGVFLRASRSGDGCGQHWLTCRGEVIPSAPEFKTVIEFSHRLTSGLAFFVVLALAVWAARKYAKGSTVRTAAFGSFIFIVVEALLGAGLVLTGNTAEAWTPVRPLWSAGHLISTFVLLAFLAITAWSSSTGGEFRFVFEKRVRNLMMAAAAAILLIGTSGSIAALSNMIFPSRSIIESLTKDFSSSSHYILRIRLLHPLLAVLLGVFLLFFSGWIGSRSSGTPTEFWSKAFSVLIMIQLAFGAITILTLGPIVMQLGHLLLADAIWISFVLMMANYQFYGRSQIGKV